MINANNYSPGDWIVHAYYGVGKIEAKEKKHISGEDAHYFKIQTKDSTFWIPIEKMNSELIRPLSTPGDIEQALDIFKCEPLEMSTNYKVRQNRIREVQLENTPNAIACLVRDLRALQRKNGVLNQSEGSVFRHLKNQFINEWVIVTGRTEAKVTHKLEKLLNFHRDNKV